MSTETRLHAIEEYIKILDTKAEEGDSPIIDSGRDTTLGTVNSNSYKDVSISFNKTFQSVPNVVACFESTATSYGFGRLSLGVHSVTTTGFKVRVFNADTGERSPYIQWIATV